MYRPLGEYCSRRSRHDDEVTWRFSPVSGSVGTMKISPWKSTATYSPSGDGSKPSTFPFEGRYWTRFSFGSYWMSIETRLGEPPGTATVHSSCSHS